ncbi:hypothetical protein Dimus_038370 [Dionaea muscipula]
MTTMKTKVELDTPSNDSKGKGTTSRESTPSRILPLTKPQTPSKTSTATPLSNRFSVLAKVPSLPLLSQFPPLSPASPSTSYAKAVQKTPSASSKIEIFPKGDQPSRYYTKLLSQKICLLPNHPSEELDARAIAGQYYPLGFHWCPSDPRKNIEFYKKILIETNSISLYDTMTPGTSKVGYSKCSIRQIHHMDKWDNSFLKHRLFSGRTTFPAFTYQDYIDAWYYVFLVRPYTHSWFLQFKKENPQEDWNMPVWFLDWWKLFGSTSIIFPTVIQALYQTYKETHPAEWPLLRCLSYHQDVGIPWIMAWDYEIKQVTVDEPLELHRVIRIKWWDTFDINKVNRSAPTPQQPQNDQELEFLKLREKAAKLEKELLQLRKRAAAFDDSQDPYEDNEDLEVFSYE